MGRRALARVGCVLAVAFTVTAGCGQESDKPAADASTVEGDGERGFRGTLDFAKAIPGAVASIADLEGNPGAVPFTALINDTGHLTLLTIKMGEAVPGLRDLLVSYTEFGKPVDVTPPPADQTTAATPDVIALLKA